MSGSFSGRQVPSPSLPAVSLVQVSFVSKLLIYRLRGPTQPEYFLSVSRAGVSTSPNYSLASLPAVVMSLPRPVLHVASSQIFAAAMRTHFGTRPLRDHTLVRSKNAKKFWKQHLHQWLGCVGLVWLVRIIFILWGGCSYLEAQYLKRLLGKSYVDYPCINRFGPFTHTHKARGVPPSIIATPSSTIQFLILLSSGSTSMGGFAPQWTLAFQNALFWTCSFAWVPKVISGIQHLLEAALKQNGNGCLSW